MYYLNASYPLNLLGHNDRGGAQRYHLIKAPSCSMISLITFNPKIRFPIDFGKLFHFDCGKLGRFEKPYMLIKSFLYTSAFPQFAFKIVLFLDISQTEFLEGGCTLGGFHL